MNELIQKLSKAIRESTKPLVEIQKNAEVDDKQVLAEVLDQLIDAQGTIADLQTAYLSLSDSKDQSMKRVKELEAWHEDKKSYESFRFFSGATVVVAKAGEQSPYQKDWYCKNCFDDNKKSQLQPDPRRDWEYLCPTCKTAYQLNGRDQETYNEIHNQREIRTQPRMTR